MEGLHTLLDMTLDIRSATLICLSKGSSANDGAPCVTFVFSTMFPRQPSFPLTLRHIPHNMVPWASTNMSQTFTCPLNVLFGLYSTCDRSQPCRTTWSLSKHGAWWKTSLTSKNSSERSEASSWKSKLPRSVCTRWRFLCLSWLAGQHTNGQRSTQNKDLDCQECAIPTEGP